MSLAGIMSRDPCPTLPDTINTENLCVNRADYTGDQPLIVPDVFSWIALFECHGVCCMRFASWGSFVGFNRCQSCVCVLIYRCSSNFSRRVVLKASDGGWDFIARENFVCALRKTTANCRVSFMDFCSVFLTNFRLGTLTHSNTVF